MLANRILANYAQTTGGAMHITIIITPVNNAPLAVDDTAQTDENIDVSIDILANDSDIERDELLISTIGSANNGTKPH